MSNKKENKELIDALNKKIESLKVIISEKKAEISVWEEKIISAQKISDVTSRNKVVKIFCNLMSDTQKEIEKAKEELLLLEQELEKISSTVEISESDYIVKSSKRAVAGLSVVAVLLALTLAFSYGKSCQNENTTSTITPTAIPTVNTSPNPNEDLAAPSSTIEVSNNETINLLNRRPDLAELVKMNGEDFLYFDATNDAQVEKRATFYMNTYFKPLLDKIDIVAKQKGLNPIYREQCTIENLSNIIRMRGNVLPKENGVPVYDNDRTISNYYSQMYNELFCNMPANTDYFDTINFIPSCYLLPDGGKEQEFTMEWDQAYDEIRNARNSGDTNKIKSAIAKLGELLRDRFLLRGLNGEMTPWNLKGNRYASTQDGMRRFSAYVVSWNVSKTENAEAVCIPVCTNYETGEIELWSVIEIFDAIKNGTYNDIIAYLIGTTPDELPIGEQFFNEQDEKFKAQYKAIMGTSYSYKG